MTNFTVDIISDPVCPWCHIGRKRLEKAIALYRKVYPNGRHDTFTINWKPFYLDPSAPVPGIPWDERSAQRIAERRVAASAASTFTTSTDSTSTPTAEDRTKSAALKARLQALGQQEGVRFSFQGLIGSTRTAHRALLYAQIHQSPNSPNLQDIFSRALLTTFFESPTPFDITSANDLSALLASSTGLDPTAALSWLESDEGAAEVDAEVAGYVASGIKGVPVFSVGGCIVDGAQSEGDFLEAFVKVKEEEQEGK
ncbi:thioredoxin-like protein [Xylariaceae sp. FL0255]|nr:thioredoxin-like protein [Xylariaceae sp. FL0255]